MKRFYTNIIDDPDPERVYSMDYWLEEMKEENLASVHLHPCEREKISDMFFCREFQEWCDCSDHPCGKICEGYAPTNGKSGRCKYLSHNSYSPIMDKIIVVHNKEYDPNKID